MKIQTLVCAMVLTLTACATAVTPVEDAFSGTTGQAYVLIASSGMPDHGEETFGFQRVDLASSTFLKEFVEVGLQRKTTFHKPEALVGADIDFGGRTILPGDYALVQHGNTGGGGINTLNCYSLGAAIYRF